MFDEDDMKDDEMLVTSVFHVFADGITGTVNYWPNEKWTLMEITSVEEIRSWDSTVMKKAEKSQANEYGGNFGGTIVWKIRGYRRISMKVDQMNQNGNFNCSLEHTRYPAFDYELWRKYSEAGNDDKGDNEQVISANHKTNWRKYGVEINEVPVSDQLTTEHSDGMVSKFQIDGRIKMAFIPIKYIMQQRSWVMCLKLFRRCDKLGFFQEHEKISLHLKRENEVAGNEGRIFLAQNNYDCFSVMSDYNHTFENSICTCRFFG